MTKLILLLVLLISSACNKSDLKFSENEINNKPNLLIATTRTWEETGAMCVVDNGDVYCWGGGGFPTNENLFQTDITPTRVESISGNAQNVGLYNIRKTCVIKSDSSLRCAGESLNPNNIIFSSGVTKIDTGSNAICAIVHGALKCWGVNSGGLLGNGTFIDSSIPVDVIGMESGVTDVSVGLTTVCAIKNGAAYCWGANPAGEIGDGTTTSSNVPVPIPTLSSGVTDISASYGYYGEPGDSAYAIKNGGLYVWGQNDWGQLGDGTTIDKLTPTLLTPFSSGVSQVDGGGIETCFLQNGDVYCFGFNDSGQIGITKDDLRYAPTKINGIDGDVLQVAAGSKRGCAVTKDKVYCWGLNGDNVIDPTTYNDQPIPKVVYTRK